MLRAHLIQPDTAWEDRHANFARVDELLADRSRFPAGVRAGDLVVLPEMFDTGFSFNLPVTTDHDGKTLAYLSALARRLGATVHGSRTVIGPDGRGRNRASIIAPDGTTLAEYDKIHPFSFGRESEFFSGGDRVVTYPWRGTSNDPPSNTVVCAAICYDLRFPELFRRGMQVGAEVIALGANWPAPRALHRAVLAQARAIENQSYVLCVNRAGSDPHLAYAGASAAYGPKGELLGQLDDKPGVLTVDLDLPALRHWRETFPACRDMRLKA